MKRSSIHSHRGSTGDDYYGRTSNCQALRNFWLETREARRKSLSRRSHNGYVNLTKMDECLMRFPLPCPRIVYSCFTWRSHVLMSGMREFRTSGSVGASDGQPPGAIRPRGYGSRALCICIGSRRQPCVGQPVAWKGCQCATDSWMSRQNSQMWELESNTELR